MAIYHCHIKTFSRSKGQSAVSAIAYRTGQKVTDELTGRVSDYRRKNGIAFSKIILPGNAPSWAKKTETLWNEVEKKEKRINSTLAREFEISLPWEMTDPQRENLAIALAENLVNRFGFVAELAIHKPHQKNHADGSESKNFHVHILASTRKLEATGFTDKTRELDEKTSGAVEEVRAMVANTINDHLEKAQISARVDHRSLEKQCLEALEKGNTVEALVLARQPLKHVNLRGRFATNAIAKNQRAKNRHLNFLETVSKKLEIVERLDKQIQKSQRFLKTRREALAGGQQKLQRFIHQLADVGKWLVDGDHFGIEKREREKSQALAQEQERLARKQAWATKREQDWQRKAKGFNEAQEKAFRQSKSLPPTVPRLPPPEPSQTLRKGPKL